MITLNDIERARRVISDFDRRVSAGILRTPLISSDFLDAMTGMRLGFKAECLQKTGSFKVPGVIHALIAGMGTDARGILGVSSGNQGLAIAYVAGLLHKPALIVLPQGASAAKVAAIRSQGAEITELHYTSYDDAMRTATNLARDREYFFPDLFADLNFVAGHGTLGLQVLEDCPDVDAIIVPGGSGALAAGLATACKAVRPCLKIFAVAAGNDPCLLTAFRKRRSTVLSRLPDTLCDGLRSPVVSAPVLDQLLAHLDDVVTVSEREVIHAMRLAWSHTRLITEPSGAVTLAALLSGRLPIARGSRVVCVLSGGNVDLDQALQYLAG